MISERDLLDAISEVEDSPDNYGKCQKLATFYTLLNYLYPQDDYGVSQAAPITEATIGVYGGSEFLQAISGKRAEEIWAVMDELMLTLSVLNPRLYAGVMRKIE